MADSNQRNLTCMWLNALARVVIGTALHLATRFSDRKIESARGVERPTWRAPSLAAAGASLSHPAVRTR
jgi:hypothetical protein